jgi:hypothetical protein
LYSSVLLVPIRSEITAHGSCYIAAEQIWTYSKHISRDRHPISLLARQSDLQKTQLPLLLLVGPCLQSCCLAMHCSNPLQYYALTITVTFVKIIRKLQNLIEHSRQSKSKANRLREVALVFCFSILTCSFLFGSNLDGRPLWPRGLRHELSSLARMLG